LSEREHEERERIDEGSVDIGKSYEGPSEPSESDTTPAIDQEIDTGDDTGSDDE